MTVRPTRPLSRRDLLRGGLGAAGVAALAACSGSVAAPPAPTDGRSSGPSSAYAGDLRLAALAAALENLAVTGYRRMLATAARGGYGLVPPAISTFATTVVAQHTEHAARWNALLIQAGVPAVAGTPLSSASSTLTTLTSATTWAGVATAAAALELSVAETCLQAVGTASRASVITAAASIAPVEAQHAAVLHLLLGTTPAPQALLPQDSAVPLTVLTT